MGMKKASPGKKPQKLKLKNDTDSIKPDKKSKLAPGIPADEDVGMAPSELVKKDKRKKKKKNISNGSDMTETDTVKQSPKPKSRKKRKKEQENPPTDATAEHTESPQEAVEQKPRKKLKIDQTEDAVDPDDGGKTAEGPAATPAPEKKTPPSKKGENPVKPKDPALEKRTVFVGNLSLKTNRRELRKFFMQFGRVESSRLRSAPRLDAKKPIRMAVITHRFSEGRSSLNAYVRFASEAGAQRAVAEANGRLLGEHRLRVDLALAETRPDPQRAVFVGGLSLNAEDDQLWARFEECGQIVSVRIVRDRQTSIGKGIGYVNFADEEAVPRALKLNGSELEGRTIRVQRCHATAHSKVDRNTGKKLRKAHPEGGKAERKSVDNKLAPVNKFSGDATAESKSSLKKKKGAKKEKKERWDDAKRQKRSLAQSLSKTIAPIAKPATAPTLSIGGVTPQNKKIKFDFGDDDAAPSEKKDSEKLKEIRLKREAKRKKKAKESQAKKKKNIVEPLTNILPS